MKFKKLTTEDDTVEVIKTGLLRRVDEIFEKDDLSLHDIQSAKNHLLLLEEIIQHRSQPQRVLLFLNTRIDLLLSTLCSSSSSSWAEKKEAVKEICHLTKHSKDARAIFGENPKKFDPLYFTLRNMDIKNMEFHPDLQQDLITVVYNLSLDASKYKKKLFSPREKVGSHLVRSLNFGSIEIKRIAAETISSMYAADDDDDSRIFLKEGNIYLEGLVSLLRDEYCDNLAITAIMKLCICPLNRYGVVALDVIEVLLEKLSNGILVDKVVDLLHLLSCHELAIHKLINNKNKGGAVSLLFGILMKNKELSEVTKEQCLLILQKIYKNGEDTILKH